MRIVNFKCTNDDELTKENIKEIKRGILQHFIDPMNLDIYLNSYNPKQKAISNQIFVKHTIYGKNIQCSIFLTDEEFLALKVFIGAFKNAMRSV